MLHALAFTLALLSGVVEASPDITPQYQTTALKVDARPLLIDDPRLDNFRRILDHAYTGASWHLDKRLTVSHLITHRFWRNLFYNRSDLGFVDLKEIEWALDQVLFERYVVVSRMDPDLIALYYQNPKSHVFASVDALDWTSKTKAQLRRGGLISVLQIVKLIRQGQGRIPDMIHGLGMSGLDEIESKIDSVTRMKLIKPLPLPADQRLENLRWRGEGIFGLFNRLNLETIEDIINLDLAGLKDHPTISTNEIDIIRRVRDRLLKKLREDHCAIVFNGNSG